MLTRRAFLIAAGAVSLTRPYASFAQQQKVRRVAYLANDPLPTSPTLVAFKGGLRELGWIEGKNLEIVFQTSSGQNELFRRIAEDIVRENVDVIVTTGSPSTAAAMAATQSIPIVFGSAANPVEQKFVASLARPGGNVTGLALLVQELGPKRLQMLKEILPRATRFARMYQTKSIASIQPAIIDEDNAAARALGVTLQQIPIVSLDQIEGAFKAAASNRIDAIHVTAAPLFVVNRDYVAELALKYGLAIMGPDGRFAEAETLASYGENFAARYRRAAFLVDKILRGAKAADIPVEQPAIFELVINLKTAKKLGVTIPETVLLQADRVIR